MYEVKLVEGIVDDGLTKDVAFNRRSFNTVGHVSPYDQGQMFVGLSDIKVRLVQPIEESYFRHTLSRAINATTGVDLDNPPDEGDWEEMLKGGLQTALETQVIVFEVSGVSRTATHQIVRTRKAAFHQQSQRASWMGYEPNVRMPKSIYENERAREAFRLAAEASARAYRTAIEEDVAYQDARFALLEGTTTYILCEYPVREFLNVYAYRACSMFQAEICHTVREMGRVLIEAHPWIAPYVKISCEKTQGTLDGGEGNHHCLFMGWEHVDEQCDFDYARETNRAFRSERHQIKKEG